MKVLCICPFGIGNYLLFYPACKILKEKCPELSLHLLALRKQIADIAFGDSLWDSIHLLDPSKEKNLFSIARFICKMRSLHFDYSLSFFPSNKWQYNLLPFVSGIKQRIAFSYALKKVKSLSFLNNCSVAVDPQIHDVYQNIRLSETFLDQSLELETVKFPLLYSQDDQEDAETLLRKVIGGYDGKNNLIAIHPGSSSENGMDFKRWSPEKFGALADRICKQLDAHALVLGGPDEKELKARVCSVMNAHSTIIEPVKLSVTAALISKCKLCLCNDSGLMHIAACSGIKVAAIFGPTDEKRNGPFGSGHLVLRKTMQGFPLWTAANVGSRSVPKGVDPQESLKALSVDEAWGMVKPWIDRECSGGKG